MSESITIESLKQELDEVNRKLDILLRREIQRVYEEPPSEWITVQEASEICHYSEYSLRQACNTGRITECRKTETGQWRISREVVEKIRDYGLPKKE